MQDGHWHESRNHLYGNETPLMVMPELFVEKLDLRERNAGVEETRTLRCKASCSRPAEMVDVVIIRYTRYIYGKSNSGVFAMLLKVSARRDQKLILVSHRYVYTMAGRQASTYVSHSCRERRLKMVSLKAALLGITIVSNRQTIEETHQGHPPPPLPSNTLSLLLSRG